MYSLQHHWPGRTFALATSCDSDGKRSRIRRSKEERKALVESFIKKYQSLNEGKFPSLNLTHKEVGGSFYTVREIVRDVIQENRVLGPGKFSSIDEKIDDNSAGSIEPASTEPGKDVFRLAIQVDNKENANMVLLYSGDQHAELEVADDGIQHGESDELNYSVSSSTSIDIELSDQTQKVKTESSVSENVVQSPLHVNADVLIVDQVGGVPGDAAEPTALSTDVSLEADKELYADSDEHVNLDKSLKEIGQDLESEGSNDGHLINGNHQIVEIEEIVSMDSPADVEASTKEPDVVVEASTVKITDPTADVPVETFPIRHSTMNGAFTSGVVELDDTRGTSGNSQKLETSGAVGLDSNGSASLPAFARTDPSDPGRSGAVAEQSKPATNATTTLDGQKSATFEKAAGVAVGEQKVDSLVSSGETLSKGTDQSREIKRPEAAEDSQVSGGSRVVKSPTDELISEKKKVAVNNSTPTLDRINLESWEETAKKQKQKKTSSSSSSEVADNNPLVAFLKALIDGFVKFWSESD